VPIRNFTASSYVAAQCKSMRLRRDWSQQRLADRLNELQDGPPPEIFKEDDPRRRQAEIRESLEPKKWTQTRIAKLERGALKRVSVDDVLELALGLDVSPIVLMTPALEPQGDDKAESWSLLRPGPLDVFGVSLLGGIAAGAQDVREWIRGVKPLLGSRAYRTNEEAVDGRRFYWAGATKLGELKRLEDAVKQAHRARASLSFFEPGDEGEADAE
jgi:transcriptional regulator with XRE-family HTH domain